MIMAKTKDVKTEKRFPAGNRTQPRFLVETQTTQGLRAGLVGGSRGRRSRKVCAHTLGGLHSQTMQRPLRGLRADF
jgi:hypothetical protein